MTSHRLSPPIGERSARPGLALFLLLAAALAIAAASACGGDDTTVNNFIGVTDASPPRLGHSASAPNGKPSAR
ncbi:MAG TPA: hypothetical protein VK540_29815 [Polyangiaceae bacterium]|jgi:hypothetical protein|nr:hypothetical protein [Polyangiaceae bacterium]